MRSTPLRQRAIRLLIATPIVFALTASLTACGPSTIRNSTTSGGSTTLSSTTLIGGTSAASSGGAAYQVAVQGTGYDTHSFQVSTGKVLKMRFIPGKQNQQASDGKFYQYSMLGVYLGVNGKSQPTELVYNGYGGGSALQSSVIDLSSLLPACADGTSDCRQTVTLTVSQPNNDDACINTSYTGCPYSHVPSGHTWNGTLVVQTDDTGSI